MGDYQERYTKIRIVADKTTVNPLLQPDERIHVSVLGVTPDGRELPIPHGEVDYRVRSLATSGEAVVATMDQAGVVTPRDGGVASVEASVRVNGSLLSDAVRIVVRPFHRKHHQLLSMKFFLAMEDGWAGGIDRDYNVDCLLTFDQVLEVVAGMDRLMRGLPKIVYLVGWQTGGHDHLYPAWDEVNPRLKSPNDASAVESLRRLMRQAAERYNTSISLHVNLNDAYDDSPLFAEYDRLGLIGRRADGSYVAYDSYAGKKMYAVSHKREWDSGYAKRRIDGLLEMLPELVDAGAIHIDNYVAKIHGSDEPMDAYHGVTVEEEQEAMRIEMLYWRSRGIDVTSEGSYHGRWDPMIGLQPMTWWDLTFDPMEIPASLYCGGRVGRLPGDPRFGDSMQGEDSLLRNISHGVDLLTGIGDEFCLTTLPWVYLNRLDRLSFDGTTVCYSDGVVAGIKNGWPHITRGDMVIRYANTVMVPVTWRSNREIIAYSDVSVHITNALPDGWEDVAAVDIYRLTKDGPIIKAAKQPTEAPNQEHGPRLTCDLLGREPALIVPSGEKP